MTTDPIGYEAHKRKVEEHKRKKASARSIAQLQEMARRAVRVEAITRDESWDLLLSFIEAGIKSAQDDLDAHIAELTHPTVVNADQIMRSKLAIASLRERINTLQTVVTLPKTIMEQGEAAQNALVEVAEGDEDG